MTHPTFEAALDAEPANWATRLAYADWLEGEWRETGNETAWRMALAQRWIVHHRATVRRYRGFWFLRVPKSCDQELFVGVGTSRLYPTRQIAEQALAESLGRLAKNCVPWLMK